mmetsp:Transcript_1803/g.3872  ORF Transcript_1803/g.3872 Transcript_1803/m.3872 type:complete len:610 (+) Transcript_1803:92-1921(+)|eukprot:CAMPEP_0172314064 /NCGR_PEP_ID=MMETSP1058-20130122/21572_1 /TAXON_ID=83371 /ORGANISM="Detonula confervacea, Strain CCMP 353" /LENGTH=609 /DNA_ID=CAMNT_0013027821 /DNA_START=71 /DNA_END=1900 /DNA_ORIENTATION=+
MKASNMRKGTNRHEEESALPSATNELPDANSDGGDKSMCLHLATKEDFEKYRDELLGRVPQSVESRFREGGFCKWGGNWLPVLELGPFDVEPGPVRDKWLKMFENSQERGREMTRLIYWYGVKYEERGQAYSFVKGTQLINYEDGKQKGCCELPKSIQNRIAMGQKVSRKEDRLKCGLMEIEADMKRDKSERGAQWMMHFKEDYEIVEEESGYEEAESKLKFDVKELKPKSKLGSSKKKENEDKSSKRKAKSKSSSMAMPDEIVSSNTSINVNERNSLTKRARREEPLPTIISSSQNMHESGHVMNQKLIKAEPTSSSSIPTVRKEGKPGTIAMQKPAPAECHLVVQELGKLHPNVIEMNDQRREVFALQKQHENGTGKSVSEKNGRYTPVTDAVISTMLSQNTTAANQNRAFASLKKAFPGGWDQVANETDISRIEDAIRVAGLAQIRAERMQNMLRTVQKERGEANFEFLQHVHSNEDIIAELSRHKGMGPKTISCVLLFALGRPDFPVDTHVLRISKQMGWIPQSLSREAAYKYMNDQVPDECKLDLHCLLVTHGKQCNKCAARGRAQFPPKEQWICPMAAIKSGKPTSFACVSPIDQKPAAQFTM